MTRARDVADTQDNVGGAVPPVVAGKNAVINGAFDIWQRGTSVSVAANSLAYTTDRWQIIVGNSQATTVSRQATGDTTNLPNIQYCARVQRNSGQTGTAENAIYNTFESVNSIPYAGKTVTMSFYARAGANYSPTSSILAARLVSGTGTDQNVLSGGFTNGSRIIDQNLTLTTTWQRFTYSVTVGTNITQLAVGFAYTPTGTAGTNDYFEITGVQLEVGSVATPFSRAGGTIQGELAACQRYYTRFTTTAGTFGYGMGSTFNTTDGYCVVALPVTMRTTPTLGTTGTPSNYRVYNGSNGFANLTAIALQNGGYNQCLISFTSSALSTNTPVWLASDTGLNGYLEFRAEL